MPTYRAAQTDPRTGQMPGQMPQPAPMAQSSGAPNPSIFYGHIGSPEWWGEYRKYLLNDPNVQKAGYSFGAKAGLERYLNMSGNQLPELLGVGTLTDILLNQGRTDPMAFNQQLAGISRDTQSNQRGVQGTLAQRGLQGSGLGQALSAAVGQQGVGQIATARANENQMAEQRKRDDLQLLLQTFINPGIDRWAIQNNQYNANANRSQSDQNSKNAMLSSILGSLANYYTYGGYGAAQNAQNAQNARNG